MIMGRLGFCLFGMDLPVLIIYLKMFSVYIYL
jgi:hypothetical protein